jgi:hypothetical protein
MNFIIYIHRNFKGDQIKESGIYDTLFLKKHLQSFADFWPILLGFSIYI